MNQLLWYYADLEYEKCYSLPGGQPDMKGEVSYKKAIKVVKLYILHACQRQSFWHFLLVFGFFNQILSLGFKTKLGMTSTLTDLFNIMNPDYNTEE